MKKSKVIKLDAEGNLVMGDQPDLTVMLVGVNDLIIVNEGGRLLVTHKDRHEEAMEIWRKERDKANS